MGARGITERITVIDRDFDFAARHHLEKFSGVLFKRSIAFLIDLFGPERLLWGSDWPVLTLAGGYREWFDLAVEAITAKDADALPAIMGGNALRIYHPSRHNRA